MADNTTKFKTGIGLIPQSTDPTNPVAGDVFYSDGTSRPQGLWTYNGSDWIQADSLSGGSGLGNTDTMHVQDFNNAAIGDFTVSAGVTLTDVDSELIQGEQTIKIAHDAALTRSFKEVVAVDNQFRTKTMEISLEVRSDATSGNITLDLYDETGAAAIGVTESIEPYVGVDSTKRTFGFELPEGCQSFSYEIKGLPEAGVNTFIDSISIQKVYQTTSTTVTDELLKENEFSARIANNGSTASITSQSSSFIQSVTRTGIGTVDITFVAGLFSVAPSITPGIEDNSQFLNEGIVVDSITSSGCSINTGWSSGTGANNTDVNFNLLVQRQNSDYDANLIRRVETKDTFSEIVVLEDRDISEINEFSAKISGSLGVSAAIISNNASFIKTITNTGAGLWQIDFVDNLFTVAPIVTIEGINPNNNTMGSPDSITTSTVIFDTGFNGSPANMDFQIKVSRQGSDVYNKTLKRIKTNPNQKIKIPSSEMRLEGATSRGTGSETFTVKFDSLTKSIGGELLLDNSNGTIITCLKDGLLSVSSSVHRSGGGYLYITKNQVDNTAVPLTNEVLSSMGTAVTASNNVSATFSVKSGDKVRISSNVTPNALASNMLELYFQEQEIQVGVSNILPKFSESDTCIDVYGYAGLATFWNKTPRLSVVRVNMPNGKVLYTDTEQEGNKFEILENGLYDVSYFATGTTNTTATLALNPSNPTTSGYLLPESEMLRLDTTSGATAYGSSGSTQIYLNKGDIVKLIGQGLAYDRCGVTISQVGKPNITSVDVSPFVDLEVYAAEDWKDSGSIIWGATITAPNKGTVQVDKTSYRRSGDTGSFLYRYKQINATGASNGNGDFLYTLPDGLSFDSEKVDFYTGALANMDSEYSAVYSLGNAWVRQGTASGSSGFIIPYDATRFRAVLENAYSTIGMHDSGFFAPLTNPALEYSFEFSAPIAGWKSTSNKIITQDQSNASDLTEYTPIFTGVGTPTNVSFRYGQEGDKLRIQGYAVSGTPSATPFSFSLPSGLNIDSSKTSPVANTHRVGSFQRFNVGSIQSDTLYTNFVDPATDTTLVYCCRAFPNDTSFGKENASTLVQAGDAFFIDVLIPIQGWSSESKYLVNVPVNKTAYIKDVKASGTAGGSASGFTSAYAARDLNTVEGDSEIVSLSSNQFTLGAGKYDIEVTQPVRRVNNFQSRLYNFSDSTVHTLGSNGYATGTYSVEMTSTIYARVDISSSKTFEVQLRTAGNTDTSDLGVANSFSDSEVYTQVKITKVR